MNMISRRIYYLMKHAGRSYVHDKIKIYEETSRDELFLRKDLMKKGESVWYYRRDQNISGCARSERVSPSTAIRQCQLPLRQIFCSPFGIGDLSGHIGAGCYE